MTVPHKNATRENTTRKDNLALWGGVLFSLLFTLLERFVPQATLETPGALDRFQGTSSWPLAHPILVRAELLALRDGRLRDVADRLLTQVILPELRDKDA